MKKVMRLNIKTISIIYFSWNLLCLFFLSFYNKTFWYDEAFSIGLIHLSFTDIWDITTLDVHPPLYYYILKIFASIFGNSVAGYHLCSLLGVFGLYFLGIFPIKRLWGIKTTYAFTLMISLLPITIYLGLEIRMYSWLAFFVLATAIYGYESYLNGTYEAYIKLSIFAICASYTHNYGLVSVLVIYFMLWIMFILNKKNILALSISSLVSLFIFAFWIPSLYQQVTAVKESYWIELFTLNQFLGYSTSFFDTLSYGIVTKTISTIIFIILYLSIFTYFFKVNKKNIDKERVAASLFFLGVFLLVLLSTATVSFLFKPILVKRYLLSVVGCLSLAVAIFIASVDNSSKFIRNCGLVIIACLSTLYTLRVMLTYVYNIKSNRQQEIFIEFFEKNIKPNQGEYTIIGSGYQKFFISILSLLEPESKYCYFFNDKDIAYNSWNAYPFDIKIINSLRNEPILIYTITDLDLMTFGVNRDKYQRSIDDLARDEQTYYITEKIDTVGIMEIRTLRRNLKNITNLDEQNE